MTSSTADPHAARAHARAMGGTRVEAMPVLPPMAADAPVPDDLVWEETVAPGGYSSRRVARGTRLRLIDLGGDACASMLLFNADTPTERLNVADTLKVQWNGYLGSGRILLSDLGRAMASVLEDEAGTHDAFCGASTPASCERAWGGGRNHDRHPSGRDRLLMGVARHGLGRRDVHPCINWFKGVRIAADGATVPELGPFAPGRKLLLRADMELVVVLANCPHVLEARPAYSVTPLRVTAWRGAPAGEDDAVRGATPEGLRAFLNTEDLYRR